MKKVIPLTIIIFVIALITLSQPDQAWANKAEPPGSHFSTCRTEKIDQGLWMLLGKQDHTGTGFGGQRGDGKGIGNLRLYGVWVSFPQPDLSHCLGLPSDERSLCVFETLVAHKNVVQAETSAYLESQGIPYQSFWLSTSIFFEGGNRDVVCTISTFDDVVKLGVSAKGYPLYSEIYEIDLAEPKIKVDICWMDECYQVWYPIAQDIQITITGGKGATSMEDLRVGQYGYFIFNEDGAISRIVVLRE